MNKFKIAAFGLSFAGFAQLLNAQTVLLAGWDFQTTTNGGTAVAAAPSTPTTLFANVGTQAGSSAIYANGTHGSSTWVSSTTASANQFSAFAGTNLNTSGTSLSTTTTTPAALAVVNSASNGSNGKALVFSLSMTNYSDLVITYAAQRTSTGFTTQTWAYSIDGVTFTDFYTLSAIATSFTVYTAATLSSVNNASTVYIRTTFTGATGQAGNNRLDNIQFSASAIPEPSTYAAIFGGLALVGAVVHRRRQRARA